MTDNLRGSKNGKTLERPMTEVVKIVRDKADKRPLSEQIDEICERLNFVVGKVSYDKNYFIIEEYHKKRP